MAPVDPLLDIQCMVTRRPLFGGFVGPDQMISLDDALRAPQSMPRTTCAARTLSGQSASEDLTSSIVGRPIRGGRFLLTEHVKVLPEPGHPVTRSTLRHSSLTSLRSINRTRRPGSQCGEVEVLLGRDSHHSIGNRAAHS